MDLPHRLRNTPLLQPHASCSDTQTHTHKLVISAFSTPVGISLLSCTLLSSACIFRAVFKIPSTRGKWQALSTCGSHLTVVSLFYGTIFAAVYLQPVPPTSSQKDKLP